MSYPRYVQPPDDHEDEHQRLAMDPRAYHDGTPSPGPRRQEYAAQEYAPQEYQMQTQQPRPYLEIPMGPGPRIGTPSDRLQPQPTYSVENLHGAYNHGNEYDMGQQYNQISPQYENEHEHAPFPPHYQHEDGGDYIISPEAHHDAYYTQPYQPHPSEDELNQYNAQPQEHYWQDDADTRPILQADTSYGPDPHGAQRPAPDAQQTEGGYMNAAGEIKPAPPAAPIKRMKTVKEVQLFQGNLVLDCPIPPRLLNQIAHAQPPERDEFTHMRYSAATCDPSDFFHERFTLRQKLFARPRHTELFIVITMYNEDEVLFARTMIGVIKNIEHMNSRSSSKTWGKDAWKKIVVCIVSDGRAKINPRTRAVLAAMGVYQDGVAKQNVNGKDVTCHLYEYTTQMTLELNNSIVSVKKGNTPVQILFALKEKNQKKINSHRWFFQAFGSVLDPNICVLIDAGTKPGRDSIYHLWKAFELQPNCAGACGEIKAMLDRGKNLLNPLVASQNFEYKISNILDKPLESAFGFISVLPGAFSAYRYVALQNDKAGQGPLEKYFAGEKMHGSNAGIFTANMYLAEDRILCFELVAKRNCNWILRYVKSATGETDVPDEMAEFIKQRRRWLNGSFFAAIYALTHFYQIFRSGHSLMRNMMFLLEFIYQTVNMIFAWFAIGNFFLVFRILTTSLASPDLLSTTGNVLSIIFEWFYLGVLLTCFVLALGNRPDGSNKFYMTMVYFWAGIMVYLMFAAIFITVRSIQTQIAVPGFSINELFKNQLFYTLIVSMASTYVMYFLMSILFFDPWHMFTSFIQYLLLTPTYVNILNVYAFCNTHDVSWGTKGDDKAAKLPTATVKPGGGVDVVIPSDEQDLNTSYENELRLFAAKFVKPPKVPNADEKQEDYYKGFRSAVVLVWMFCNLVLAAVVLDTGGIDRVQLGTDNSTQRATIYMAVVLWSVAGLSAFRALGASWFLLTRLFRGE